VETLTARRFLCVHKNLSHLATGEDASRSPFWGAQAASLFISAACR
jgi:hypothetical protein